MSGGPLAKDEIRTKRVTKGTFIRSGRTFTIEDDYSVERDAHRMLEGAWTGSTEFQGCSKEDEAGLVSQEASRARSKAAGHEDDKINQASEVKSEGEMLQ